MRKFLQTTLYELSFYVEIIISIILGVVLAILTTRLVVDISGVFETNNTIEHYLQNFLNQAMSIAIGVELIKMLTKHTSSTIIEVLLFALARQLVVSHGSALDTLLTVISLAILFASRKFLLSNFDDPNSIIVRGSQTVKMANLLARVDIPCQNKELMRDFMVRHLKEEEKTVAIGAFIHVKDLALRVDSMSEGIITRVEIIKSHY
ncbi:phosphate-starvation-inducible PsiE family protein [Streptococcus thoraltensis]|uniref:phosphate-starvation-inducible PsiE family protein n=1 Tax=Streptococcus thoraltensis TaxID=55085 RepID=UPI000375F816|nr:phosphate-starvation-inducible PsiE family protein [Streptococcus thoraltensis]MDY4761627.1 phosphate-starvation-inducible PsiE family protein [Streptococcus thoraltensis]